jgi:trans-aconitate 2-methyltransferase
MSAADLVCLGSPHMTYTFGDTDAAGLRLRLLADVYEASSQAFLAALPVPTQLALCVDLGCGPGYTTALLARSLQAHSTVGVDQSEPFIARARATQSNALRFVCHDVTALPLPFAHADVIYSRFVLTHLREPARALHGWSQHVTPRGVLALEELEHMSSSDPVLSEYYGIVEAMQRAHGQDMYIGTRLEPIVATTPWRLTSSRVHRFQIPGQQMARLHHLNLQTWQHDAFVRDHYAAAHIQQLGTGLGELASSGSDVPVVDYCMRQLICHAPSI